MNEVMYVVYVYLKEDRRTESVSKKANERLSGVPHSNICERIFICIDYNL